MKKLFSVACCLLFIADCLFSQNIGIGTSSPVTKLHVSGTAGNIAIFNGGNQMYITLAENGTNLGYIGSYSGNAEDVDFGTYSGNTGKVHLTTNNTPRLTVMNNGNIGIGTTSPQQKFSVAGGMNIDQDDDNTGTITNMLRFGSNSGEGIGSNRTPGVWSLDFYSNSLRRMTITNGGSVGIGLTNPSAKLEIRGALGFSSTTKRWEMNYDSTNSYFYIDEFGAGRRLAIKNGGNVGINTTNPQTTLDVNGDINIENKLLLNNSAGNNRQVLVSNGNAAAPTWQSIAYSNNDRFLYRSDNDNFFNLSDTLGYGIDYANSSAINYYNKIFTINKTGLYRIEGSIMPIVVTASGTTYPSMTCYFGFNTASGFSFYTIYNGGFTFTGNNIWQHTASFGFTMHLVAGTTFYVHIGLNSNTGSGGITQRQMFFCPLAINYISE